jgi:cysteinyl-tRNA synthetase
MDFALWKSAKPGEPAWDSPWGKGRPGWHIECSAMNLSHLGEQIDIHGGGNDLVFPHHENEIAQTESLTGKPFARYWMHNGMVQLGGEKMSKSLGNLVTIKDFLANHKAEALRMMVLNSSYRNPLTFTEDVVLQAEKALERLRSAIRPASPGASGSSESFPALETQLGEVLTGFTDAMDDDFNTAGALGHLFDLVRAINQARADGANNAVLAPAQEALKDLTGVLGLELDSGSPNQSSPVEPFIELLIELRREMRQQKLWSLSDKIRDRLSALGIMLEDGKDSTTWRFKD